MARATFDFYDSKHTQTREHAGRTETSMKRNSYLADFGATGRARVLRHLRAHPHACKHTKGD
jgi:hypothetical protein